MLRHKGLIAAMVFTVAVAGIVGYDSWRRSRPAIAPEYLAVLSDLASPDEWQIGKYHLKNSDTVSVRVQSGERLPAFTQIKTKDENWSNFRFRKPLRKVNVNAEWPRLNVWLRLRQRHVMTEEEELESICVLNGGPRGDRELSLKGKFVAPCRPGIYELQLVVHPTRLGTVPPRFRSEGQVICRTLMEVAGAN